MKIHAIVHTQGVVLGKTYLALELAYLDRTGYEQHFLIKSPISYREAQRRYPHSRPDCIMAYSFGTRFSEVLYFLQCRYKCLEKIFRNEKVIFGYKGRSYQHEILEKARIPNIFNVEKIGVHTLSVRRYFCVWHKGPSKCALEAVRLFAYVLDK